MARYPAAMGLGAAAVVLAACATSVPSPVETSASGGSPLPVAGYDWFLNQEAGDPRLVFGLANSDDLVLTFSCVPGSGDLAMATIADSPQPEIHLESGGETERFPAAADISTPHDAHVLTASAQTDAPIFQRFRRVGWIALVGQGQRATLTPQPGSVERIERFFGLCG